MSVSSIGTKETVVLPNASEIPAHRVAMRETADKIQDIRDRMQHIEEKLKSLGRMIDQNYENYEVLDDAGNQRLEWMATDYTALAQAQRDLEEELGALRQNQGEQFVRGKPRPAKNPHREERLTNSRTSPSRLWCLRDRVVVLDCKRLRYSERLHRLVRPSRALR